jgi:hypothetical protein
VTSPPAKKTAGWTGAEASRKIDARIEELGDWRGKALARVRALIHEVVPDVVEEWKWEKPKSGGVPIWSHDGILCTGESHRELVKFTFARGASLKDPKKLFTSSLDGHTRRAVDLREGQKLDAPAFKALVREAVAANAAARAPGAATKEKKKVEVPIPPDLRAALREEGMLPTWESMPPGLRAYLVKDIEKAVQDATRAKRVVSAVEQALARHEKRVDREAR